MRTPFGKIPVISKDPIPPCVHTKVQTDVRTEVSPGRRHLTRTFAFDWVTAIAFYYHS